MQRARAQVATRPPDPRLLGGRQAAYFALVYLLAAGSGVAALLDSSWTSATWGKLALLGVLAIGFEEGARRAARLQLRLSAELKRDMSSVWAIAAAVALTPAAAVVLIVVVLGYVWLRQQRPAGEALSRKGFNAATVVIALLCAHAAISVGEPSWSSLPWRLTGAVDVLAAIAVYTVVNRALVTVGLINFGVRGRQLLGSAHDNLIEIATLCLGGLVALAALYEPWLSVLVIAPMVTLQRGALVRELESAATVDAKTGLLNAVAWEHLATRELARAEREGATVAVLIIDVDRFKAVNDEYGHLAGDRVLRGVGRSIEASVREYDTVGRFGGEEFVAVLPDVGDDAALTVAERIRTRVNEMTVRQFVDGALADVRLAVSIGVARTPADGLDLSDLLHAADAALYRAKAEGRNRVALAERGPGGPVTRPLG